MLILSPNVELTEPRRVAELLIVSPDVEATEPRRVAELLGGAENPTRCVFGREATLRRDSASTLGRPALLPRCVRAAGATSELRVLERRPAVPPSHEKKENWSSFADMRLEKLSRCSDVIRDVCRENLPSRDVIRDVSRERLVCRPGRSLVPSDGLSSRCDLRSGRRSG